MAERNNLVISVVHTQSIKLRVIRFISRVAGAIPHVSLRHNINGNHDRRVVKVAPQCTWRWSRYPRESSMGRLGIMIAFR